MNSFPKVLYVEDDALSRMVVEILLREKLYLSHVVIFPDSRDFRVNLDHLPFEPDIILLDIHIKPLDGFQMLHILRGHPVFAQKRIAALTASVMNEEVVRLRDAGFDGVLSKPLDENMFPAQLTRLLNGEKIWSIS
jgi:CheY-like chemotaxis protein